MGEAQGRITAQQLNSRSRPRRTPTTRKDVMDDAPDMSGVETEEADKAVPKLAVMSAASSKTTLDSGAVMPKTDITADNWTEDPPPKPMTERIHGAKKKNSACLDFLSHCGCSLCCFPFFMMLAILMIVVGAIKMRECTVEPKIPPFLIAYGTVLLFLSLVKGVLKSYKFCRKAALKKKMKREKKKFYVGKSKVESIVGLMMCVLILALLAFHIAFAVYVLKVYEPVYEDEASSDYCDNLVYMFALVYLLVVLSILAVKLCLCCTCCCCCLWMQVYFRCKERKRRKRRRIPRSSTAPPLPTCEEKQDQEGSEPEEERPTDWRLNISATTLDRLSESLKMAAEAVKNEDWGLVQRKCNQEEWQAEAAKRANARF